MIQINKYVANNEKLSDLSDSTIEPNNNRNKKRFIRNTKIKKKSNDNNSTIRNNNMMQIRQYSGINDKYQKKSI